ncbi:MAG TPA: class I SAM-dependent methyltransferase [Pyrinomonadaceae bacterium]|nr:class I SAM-dependent methyltransferase [Pyrinomonadaceae bacterium]HMP65368.1 class I SAM-dependent methyltransferase [Pyrinomonadaceae bacterium]
MKREEFIRAIEANGHHFGLELSTETVEKIASYYELVMAHNPLLHLAAPCSAEEFAVRHVLESLMLAENLPQNARFADVGPGAGLPSVPCLIARPDLTGYLIESKPKKAGFLQTVSAECGIAGRTTIINSQFSETPRPDVSYVTSRALDRFQKNLPRLVKWSAGCTLLLFGGKELGDAMRKCGLRITPIHLPLSERRYLFISAPYK